MKPREPFNALSHAFGALAALIASVALVLRAPDQPLALVGFIVFGLGCLFLYSSSALYHWASLDHKWLQRLDHCAIYVMIAGAYTPIALLALPPAERITILSLQWALALVGVIVSATRDKTPTLLRLTLYLVMGWMALALINTLYRSTDLVTVLWLLAGGVAYTVGAIIYATRKPTLWPGKFASHELWHLFVIAGTACHFAVMFRLPLN